MRKILVVKFRWLVLPPLPIYTLKRIKKMRRKERERERGVYLFGCSRSLE